MPLRKHDPVDKATMGRKGEIYTICETLREIYRLTDDEEIRLKVRIATSMAKSMDKKIREYTPKYTNNFYDKNKDKRKEHNDRIKDSCVFRMCFNDTCHGSDPC